MKAALAAGVLALCAAATACQDDSSGLERTLAVEATLMVTSNSLDLEAGCGRSQAPNHGIVTYRLLPRGESRVDVYNEEEEWTLSTTRFGDVLVAEAVEADLPRDAYIRQFGVIGRFFRHFELNTASGELHAVAESPWIVQDTRRERLIKATTCYIKGHLPPAEGQLRILYEGRHDDDGEHDEAEPCRPENHSFWTSRGALLVKPSPDQKTAEIVEEGAGCTFTAHSDDGLIYEVEPGTACLLDEDFGMPAVGIVSKVFDAYRLDLAAKTLTYRARQTRIAGDGSRRTVCLDVELALTL